MLRETNAGWPYPINRFVPKLTSNNITPQNVATKAPELAANLLEQRTYNEAVSDLRLGEEAEAAAARADFAPIQQAVEQLGVISGLSAVAPEQLAEAYAGAIRSVVNKGGDIKAVVDKVTADMLAKIKAGEFEFNKVDGVLERIGAIAGAPDIRTGDGEYKIDSRSGKLLDAATDAPVADIRKMASGYRITVPGSAPITVTNTEYDKVFNSTGAWGKLKPETKTKINQLYAAINPAKAAPIDYDPYEREEKRYKSNVSKTAREKALEAEVSGKMFAPGAVGGVLEMDVEGIDADNAQMELKAPDGTVTQFIATKKGNTISIANAATGAKVASMPVTAFAAWMDASDVFNPEAIPTDPELRKRVVKTELNKKTRRGRVDYIAEIKKVYDAAGMEFEKTDTGKAIAEANNGRLLYGEGKKGARVTFGDETKAISRKLFNEVSRQLDELEARGKISKAQRKKMLKTAAQRLKIKV
jgi:hypothetical protein